MNSNKKNKYSYPNAIFAFMVILLFLTFFSKSFYNYNLPIVSVTTSKQGELDFSTEGTGEVWYADVCPFYTDKDGIIEDIFIEEGDEIKKGQRLMQIKFPDTNETDDIVAEKNGIVTSIEVKKGMYVSYMTNTVLYEVAEASDKRNIVLQVADEEIDNVEEGSKATIKLLNENLSFQGEVIQISPYIDSTFTGYTVDIRFHAGDISIIGKRADVTIRKASTIYNTLIPNSALRKDAKGYYVLILQKNDSILGDGYVAQRISVDLIDSDDSYCAVEGPLENESVIVAATREIAEGVSVYYEGKEDDE